MVDSGDKPTLSIDGKPVAVMSFATFTSVDLEPGKHRISLAANANDSEGWNTEGVLETKPGRTYYVAIWHQRQPKPTPSHMYAYGVAGVLMSQLLNPPTGERTVQLESISREIAEFAVTELRKVPPAQ